MLGQNMIMIVCYAVMGLGVAVLFGVFDRIGPINTPARMRMLGWGVIALGVMIGLTQSTPIP